MRFLVFAVSLFLSVAVLSADFKAFKELRESYTVLENKLKVAHTEYYGGFHYDSDKKVYVVLTTDFVETDLKLIELATKGHTPSVDVRLVKYSEKQLTQAVELIEVLCKNGKVRISVYANIMANNVQIFVEDKDIFINLLRRHGFESMDMLNIEEAPYPFDAPTASVNIRGGVPMKSVTTGLGCTAGFSAKSTIVPSWEGVVTAGHCDFDKDSERPWDDYFGFMTFEGSTALWRERYGQYARGIDIQWRFRSSDSPTPLENLTFEPKIKTCHGGCEEILYGAIEDYAQKIGDKVCKYGKTTGETCGKVVSVTYKPSYVPDATANFVLVKNDGSGPMVAGGDSGGPFYYWTEPPYVEGLHFAYGITSGLQTSSGNAIYTKIQRGLDTFNLELITEDLDDPV